MTPYAVPRLWPGSTIACVASGPSLTAEDCEYLRGKCRVVAVNDGVRLVPFADVLYSSDWFWWDRHSGWPTFHGLKIGMCRRSMRATGYQKYPDMNVINHSGDRGLELQPTALKTGTNSGYAAINLAVHLGAARVLLLGYNMGKLHGRAHFFGPHTGGLKDSQAHDYATMLRHFTTILEPLKASGVEVVNCTPNSFLQVFPKMDLREALPASAEVAA